MKVKSKIYHTLYSEQLQLSSDLLTSNGYICLFGTKQPELNAIYSQSLSQIVKAKLSSAGKIKKYDLPLVKGVFYSLSKSKINIENEDDLTMLNILNFSHFIENLKEKDINNVLEEIQNLISKKNYFILNYDGSNGTSAASLATFQNRSTHFVPDAGHHGLIFFIHEKSQEKSLIIDSTCIDLMLQEIDENNTPIPVIIETLNQIDLLLKENIQGNRPIFPTHFEQVGGFKNVLQVKGTKLRKKYYQLIKLKHSSNIPLNEKQIKKLFLSFVLIDNNNSTLLSNLNEVELAKKSNIDLHDINIFLNVAKEIDFKFIETVDNKLTLASTYLLSHWPDMKNWIDEEIEIVSLYKSINKKALSYFNGITGLLTEDILKKALQWIDETTPTLDWAMPYGKEFELTITYIQESEKQRLAQIEARQRRSKRLLNTTRLISFIIGFAFLVSTLAALFAFLERNNAVKAKEFSELRRKEAIQAKEQAIAATKLAEKERLNALIATKAEKIAKIQAESDKITAISSRDLANQEKLKAIEAKNAEILSKEIAEEERKIAISAKIQADKEKQNALKARIEADNSYVEASNNFKKAEKLRKQQEARADALKSFRLYLNNEPREGLTLARNAYKLNLENEGYQFDTDIIKAMIFGLNEFTRNKNNIHLNQPLRNVTISPSGKYHAVASINGLISVFNSKTDGKINDFKVPLNEFQSFCFSNKDQLLVGTKSGDLNIYELNNQLFKFTSGIKLSNSPIKSVISISTDQNTFLASSGGSILMIHGLSERAIIQTKVVSTNHYLNKLDYHKNSATVLIPLEKSLQILHLKKDSFENKIQTIKEFPNKLTSIYNKNFKGETLILMGDVKGYIHLINLKTGEPLLSKKLHQSAVTSCLIEIIDDHLMLISSGLDQEIQVEYLFFNTNNQLVTNSTANFDLHTGWVTDMSYHTQSKTYYSCSEDMTLRKWNFNPSDILDLINEKLKNNN